MAAGGSGCRDPQPDIMQREGVQIGGLHLVSPIGVQAILKGVKRTCKDIGVRGDGGHQENTVHGIN